jgi:cAMP phosphodiesterase
MDCEDFFDMDPFELAFALGMAETIAEEQLEGILIEREFGQDDEDKLFDD